MLLPLEFTLNFSTIFVGSFDIRASRKFFRMRSGTLKFANLIYSTDKVLPALLLHLAKTDFLLPKRSPDKLVLKIEGTLRPCFNYNSASRILTRAFTCIGPPRPQLPAGRRPPIRFFAAVYRCFKRFD